MKRSLKPIYLLLSLFSLCITLCGCLINRPTAVRMLKNAETPEISVSLVSYDLTKGEESVTLGIRNRKESGRIYVNAESFDLYRLEDGEWVDVKGDSDTSFGTKSKEIKEWSSENIKFDLSNCDISKKDCYKMVIRHHAGGCIVFSATILLDFCA